MILSNFYHKSRVCLPRCPQVCAMGWARSPCPLERPWGLPDIPLDNSSSRQSPWPNGILPRAGAVWPDGTALSRTLRLADGRDAEGSAPALAREPVRGAGRQEGAVGRGGLRGPSGAAGGTLFVGRLLTPPQRARGAPPFLRGLGNGVGAHGRARLAGAPDKPLWPR